ncbi:MAG: peptide chain release factor 1 [Myxococcota bacterium]
MHERLEEVAARYSELEEELARPENARNPNRLRELSKELASLRDTVRAYDTWKSIRRSLEENERLLTDPDAEIRELARTEVDTQRQRLDENEAELRLLLVPKDPADEKNVVLEIRAGTGGEEAALFAADLFRAYTRYAERKGWQVEVLSLHATDAGGIREEVATLSGRGVYGILKYESGVHRVQRVPVTESAGRIHTSTVTVAVLLEAEEVDVQIDEQKDLRIDVYRSSGPGGQSVNTTDSAVRITHLPSGLVVTCQDEKSQHKNRARAMKILRSRLFDLEHRRQQEERAEKRRGQIGTGDRSERIRTYNFPQNRVTDHRIQLTLHKLEAVLDGNLDELIEAIRIQAMERGLA